MTRQNIRVIATGPYGFPGASQILCQYLQELSRASCEVHYIGIHVPFFFEASPAHKVQCHILEPLSAGVIGLGKAVQSTDVLLTEQLTELILKIAMDGPQYPHTVLWGTYLFPYGQASLAAQRELHSRGIQSKLWITPTGSDIWEIGPHLQRVTRSLLHDPDISHLLTYTEQFAVEIKQRFGETLRIDTVYPIIDFSRFHPLAENDRARRRRELAIGEKTFVITSHSNMRPVKAPEDVAYIAAQSAKAIDRPVLLMLIGPEIDDLRIEHVPNLEIRKTGVVRRVEEFLQISDLELNCSRHDSFNLSLAEAMACGVPCATTDVAGIAQEIEESDSGILFPIDPPRNTSDEGRYSAAVAGIIKIAGDDLLRCQLGQAAQTCARRAFSAVKIIPRIMALTGQDST